MKIAAWILVNICTIKCILLFTNDIETTEDLPISDSIKSIATWITLIEATLGLLCGIFILIA